MGRSERKRSIKKTVIISAAAGLLVLCLAVMITVHVLLKQNFSRGEYSEYSVSYRYSHYEDGYPRTPVSFRSGKNTLRGYIYGGDNDKGTYCCFSRYWRRSRGVYKRNSLVYRAWLEGICLRLHRKL